jgi:hypothetical protein
MSYCEAGQEIRGVWYGLGCDVSDKMAHFPLDGGQEVVELLRVTCGYQFHASAGEVADVTGDFKLACKGLAPVAKAHPLDMARIVETATLPMHATVSDEPRGQGIPRSLTGNS